MKNIILLLFVISANLTYSQDECFQEVERKYNFKPQEWRYLSDPLNVKEKFYEVLVSSENYQGGILSAYQTYLFQIYCWENYLTKTSDKFEKLKNNLVLEDTLKNGKKILDIINAGIGEKEILLKIIDKYRIELNPLMESYLAKPNNKNAKKLCEWESKQEILLFGFMPPWYNKGLYSDQEWEKLPRSLKIFLNAFIPEYFDEIKKIVDERIFYQRAYVDWKEPLSIVDFKNNNQIILLDSIEVNGVKFLCQEKESIGLLLAGNKPGFEWVKAKKIAGLLGSIWGASRNATSNGSDDAECYIINKFSAYGYYEVVKTSVLKFNDGRGTITHNFDAKALYDKDMNIDKTIEFKIQNDTLFERKSGNWDVVYWASNNDPKLSKNLTRELTLIPGLTRTAFAIGDKNTVPGSKALAYAIGDKTKVLLLYYIAHDFKDYVSAIQLLKKGDEVLFLEQENKRLEQDVKTCSYCSEEYTGKTHLATYDDKKYQCGEYTVSNYKEYNKIFCSAKCALEYCRKTKY